MNKLSGLDLENKLGDVLSGIAAEDQARPFQVLLADGQDYLEGFFPAGFVEPLVAATQLLVGFVMDQGQRFAPDQSVTGDPGFTDLFLHFQAGLDGGVFLLVFVVVIQGKRFAGRPASGGPA